MSTVIRDLWPDELATQDVLTPYDILSEQADFLTARTNNVLSGQVQMTELDDRKVLGFEVIAPKINKTVRVFAVEHRLEIPYPAKFVFVMGPLPAYLQASRVVPASEERVVPSLMNTMAAFLSGSSSDLSEPTVIPATPEKVVVNPWVASSPSEFTERLGKVLVSAEVKAIIFSLLAQSKSHLQSNGQQ